MKLLRLSPLVTILLFGACQKKDTVLTPQQEAEYKQMMNKAMAEHPPPTYDELKRENEELKDRETERAMDRSRP